MAADAYLKVAAGQLQQGATELKREADQARAEATAARQQIDRDLTNLESDARVTKVDAERNRDDASQYAALALRAKQLEQQIDAKKRERDQIVARAEQRARAKEGAMQGLQSEAQKLQSQAGDPALQ